MDKISFRVEIDEIHERRLKHAARTSGKPMTQVARELFMALPYPVSDRIEDFRAKHPLLFRKLEYWAGQRNRAGSLILEQVSEYVSDLVLVEEYEDARVAIARWGGVLGSQEKSALMTFLPDAFYDKEMKDRLRGLDCSSWYSTAEGDYAIVAEPVIEELEGGAITQNRYEAFILNADEMMIVDVDLRNEDGWMELDPVVTPSRAAALGALKVFCNENPGMGFRVYETACGLRYICTTHRFKADSRESLVIMRSLFCDPRYLVLCQKQATYRARLTPKPWRLVDFDAPFSLWDNDWFEEGVVCRRLDSVGSNVVLSGFMPMLNQHDAISGANHRPGVRQRLV